MNANVKMMKELNVAMLRAVLIEQKQATIPELAKLTGLSVVTMHSLMKVLVEHGEVKEIQTSTRGGRPASCYQYDANYQLALLVGMYEQDGQELAFMEVMNVFKEPVLSKEFSLHDVTQAKLENMVDEMMKQYPRIQVIVFGMPGEESQGSFVEVDFEQFVGCSFITEFKKAYGIEVLFENDMNAAIRGYCCRNKLQDAPCVVGLYFPSSYPPGAGIFMNGTTYKGSHGLAGEIKFLPFGIDWETFDYTQASRKDVMIKMCIAIICLFDPQQIVLYSNVVLEDDYNDVMQEVEKGVRHLVVPKIEHLPSFQNDFEQGLKEVAWSVLQPKPRFT